MCGKTKGSGNISAGETDRNNGANTNIMSSPERDIDENAAGNFIIPSVPNANKRNITAHHHRHQMGITEPTNNCDSLQERRLRQLRRNADWQWLHACIGKLKNLT